MAGDKFLVEFDRGAGAGGSKLMGELVLYNPRRGKGRKLADFIFPDFNDVVYSFDLEDGHPAQAKLRGKLRISEHEREDLQLRLELFKSKATCHFCKGPAFMRERGQAPPKQVRHGTERNFKFVWSCPKCRQLELVK